MPVTVKTRPKTTDKKTQKTLKQQQTAEQVIIGREQSMVVMGTVVFATFSCVTYLRGLLNDDSFEDSHIGGTVATPGPGPGSQDSVKGLRIKSLKRDGSAEASKLCDYIDLGAMDALKKGYLRSIMILIFLNPDEPDNIVESYNLNIFDASAGGSITLQIGGPNGDAATTLGAPITVGEVKRTVKKLIRSLIVATQNLKDLPQTRFLDVKLLYHSHTPDDYEPPCFKAAESDLYYATHSASEVPDKSSIGKFQTGHHGMAIKASSIVEYLPHNDPADDEAFAGKGKSMSHAGSVRKRTRSNDELLANDAPKRTCIWEDAEQLSKDRSDFEQDQPDLSVFKPIGLKINGVIQPAVEDVAGRHRERSAVMTPGGGTVIGFPGQVTATPFSPTQPIDTQKDISMHIDNEANARNSATAACTQVAASQQVDTQPQPPETLASGDLSDNFMDVQSLASRGIDTMALLDKQREEAQLAIDVEMESNSTVADPVDTLTKRTEAMQVDKTSQVKTTRNVSDGMDCCCGDPMSDGLSIECTKCNTWVHAACAGYDPAGASLIPEDFTCQECQLEPKLAKMSRVSKLSILKKLERLAQFRRLLAGPWTKGNHNKPAISESAIRKQLACNEEDARAQLNNLVQLNFARYGKSRGKNKAGPLKWNKDDIIRAEYYDYFNPNSRQEQDLMQEADQLLVKDNAPDPEPEPEQVPETQPTGGKRGKAKASRGMELLDVTTEW